MCALCGVADASHDQLLLRLALLSSGSGSLLVPHRWLHRIVGWARRGLQEQSAQLPLTRVVHHRHQRTR